MSGGPVMALELSQAYSYTWGRRLTGKPADSKSVTPGSSPGASTYILFVEGLSLG